MISVLPGDATSSNSSSDSGSAACSWEQVLAICARSEGLDDSVLLSATEAINRLKLLLGDTVLLPDSEGYYHPIRRFLFNTAPWTRHWLIWLSNGIVCFQDSAGFEALASKLRRRLDFFEGVFALEVAGHLRHCGAVAFERNTESASRRQPDLTVEMPEVTLSVELVSVGAGDDFLRASETLEGISTALHKARIGTGCWAGKIGRIHSEQRLEDTIGRIRSTAEQIGEKGFTALEIPSVIELGMCLPGELVQLEHWAARHHLKPGTLEGPPVSEDDLRRVRARLRKKARGGQLPPGKPGIIVIRSSGIMGHDADPEGVAMALEEESHAYSNLMAVVVIGRYPGRADKLQIPFSDSVFAITERIGIEVRNVLFIRNRFAQPLLSDDALLRLQRCFTSL